MLAIIILPPVLPTSVILKNKFIGIARPLEYKKIIKNVTHCGFSLQRFILAALEKEKNAARKGHHHEEDHE